MVSWKKNGGGAKIKHIFMKAGRRGKIKLRLLKHYLVFSCLMIYKIGSEIWGPSKETFGGQKRSKFGPNFGQLCKFISNISVTIQDIVERKTALQTVLPFPPLCMCINLMNLAHGEKLDKSFDRPNEFALCGSSFIVCTWLSRSIE